MSKQQDILSETKMKSDLRPHKLADGSWWYDEPEGIWIAIPNRPGHDAAHTTLRLRSILSYLRRRGFIVRRAK